MGGLCLDGVKSLEIKRNRPIAHQPKQSFRNNLKGKTSAIKWILFDLRAAYSPILRTRHETSYVSRQCRFSIISFVGAMFFR